MRNIQTLATNLNLSWENSVNNRSSLQIGFSFGNRGDFSVSLKLPNRSLFTIRLVQYSLTSVSVIFLEISSEENNQTEKEILLLFHSNQIMAENLKTKDRTIQINNNKYEHKLFQTTRKHGKSKFEYYGWGENDDMKGRHIQYSSF